MFKKHIYILLVLLLLPLCGAAQKKNNSSLKKDVSQARTYLKAGNNLDKAEQLIEKQLLDSAARRNDKLWILLFEAVRKQYEQGNEKLYLKQKYDTAQLFNLTMKMFNVLESLDSIDALPDAEGNVHLQYRKRHGEFLKSHRRNLFNGGLYFMKKQRFQEAYRFFDKYIDCAVQPLFSPYRYAETDTLMPEAGYWAAYCGYKNKDAKAMLHHTYLALKDTAHYSAMLQYLSDTYWLEGDTVRYEQTLLDGFGQYTTDPFFYSRLVDFYMNNGQWERLLGVADKALRADSTQIDARVVRSTALLNLARYGECVAVVDSLVQRGDTIAEAFYNAGMACFYQAVDLDKKLRKSNRQRQQMLSLYQQARQYLENFRRLAPDDQKRWALPLYTIYLNLNMGDEFDEINRIIKGNSSK